MSSYFSTSASSSAQRERMMSFVAAALGVLMFIWGFFKWLKPESSGSGQSYGGYAFSMPTTAVIGTSLAAGLIALFGALDRREGQGVPTAVPLGLAATSALLALGILLGKGSVTHIDGGAVKVQVGLILALITAILQTLVLGAEWMSRQNEGLSRLGGPGGPASYPGQQAGYPGQQAGYPGQPVGSSGEQAGYPGQPGGYSSPIPPPAQTPQPVPPSAQPTQTFGPPGGAGQPGQQVPGGYTPPPGGTGYPPTP
jgi:hypothetical protein